MYIYTVYNLLSSFGLEYAIFNSCRVFMLKFCFVQLISYSIVLKKEVNSNGRFLNFKFSRDILFNHLVRTFITKDQHSFHIQESKVAPN